MKQIIVLKLMVLLILSLLSACADLDETPPELAPAAAWPNKTAFANAGTLYRWDSLTLKLRTQGGTIGHTSEQALVPLLFGSDGRLKKQTDLRGLRYFKQNASTSAKAVAYLRSIGVSSVYFTDYSTYRRVMSAYSRYGNVLTAYSVTTTSSVKSVSMFKRTVRYFNPYARRTSATSASLGPAANRECAVALPVSPGFPVSVGHVSGTIYEGGMLLPQQDGQCVAKCIAEQTVMMTGCLAVPFPWSILCVIASGTYGTICVNGCY